MIEHSWDISSSEAIRLQGQLAALVRVEPLRAPVRRVAGADCTLADSGRRIVASAVLCDADTMDVVASATVSQPCRFPYVPGLLSFREAPAVIEAVRKLIEPPDLLMIDGQGLAHPRLFGLACHVGVLLDVPTIGVAKSRLCGDHRAPGLRRGSRTSLRLEGKIVGAVVRTRTGVRPLYVSVGHRVTLTEALRWVLRAARGFRLPEPTRQAHHCVGEAARRFAAGSAGESGPPGRRSKRTLHDGRRRL